MKYIRKFEAKFDFEVGEKTWSTAFKHFFKVISFTDRYIRIEDEDGNQGDFLIKDFIPETEYYKDKYEL